MSNAPLDGPQPQQLIPDRRTPYVLGVLNVLFGALLCAMAVLMALATVASLFVNPYVESLTTAAMEQVKAERARQIAAIDELREKASVAEDSDERSRLDLEADALEAKLGPEPVDVAKIMQQAQANKLLAYGLPALKYSTSLVVNGLLIYLGVGLMRLRESARRGTIGLAWIKIGRLLLIAILELALVVPMQVKLQHEVRSSMQVSVGPAGGPSAQQAKQIEDMMMVITTVAAFATVAGFAAVGVIYPIVLLWLLTRPRVKLAFQITEAGLAPSG